MQKRATFLTSGWDGTVRQWTLTPEGAIQRGIEVTRECEPAFPAKGGTFLGLAMSTDGRRAGAIVNRGPNGMGSRRNLLVWDFKADARKPALEFATSPGDIDFCAVTFIPDDTGVATADREGTIRVWDLPGLKERPVRSPQPHALLAKGMVWGLALSPDG
ncbi:MAG: hypothetical protein C0467_24215 [Planctomycetaceae bacterium]|nr:hypothetical protein [Planctomycetaceae bacterium]